MTTSRHEDRRLLPPRSVRLGRCKRTLDHGRNENSAVGVFTRPRERPTLTKSIPNGPHFFEFLVILNGKYAVAFGI